LGIRKRISKVLLTVSLALSVVSIFQPLLIEQGTSPLAIYPPIRSIGRFWSYQSTRDVYQGDLLIVSYTVSFQEYWFDGGKYGMHSSVYLGWMLVFLCQISTVAIGLVSIVKERVKGYPLLTVCAVAASTITIILCVYQMGRHLDSGRGFGWHMAWFDVGFLFALLSFVSWLILLLIFRHRSRKLEGKE